MREGADSDIWADWDPKPDDFATGQEAMAVILRITPRHLRRLIREGRLEWIERIPRCGGGAPPIGRFVVKSGTAFRETHRVEVRETLMKNLSAKMYCL